MSPSASPLLKKDYRILVVDDEPFIREVLQKGLGREGYVCETAANGKEALDRLAATPYDLVLADVIMPGMGGVELLKHIQEDYPRTAVIMVTAMADVDLAVQTLTAGAFNFIAKPFNIHQVTAVVGQAMEKQQLLRENEAYRANLEQLVADQTKVLARQNRDLAAINEIILVASRSNDQREIVQRALASLVTGFHAAGAFCHLVAPDLWYREGKTGKGTGTTRDRQRVLARTMKEGRSLFATAGKVLSEEDLETLEPGPVSLDWVALPLREGEKVVGGFLLAQLILETGTEVARLLEFLGQVSRELGVTFAKIHYHRSLEQEILDLRERMSGAEDEGIVVGPSGAFQKIVRLVEKVQNTTTNILLRGESGTGKEVVARLIHYGSGRREKPFITVNCAALPDELMESELFGVAKGTATGVEERIGKFEAAQGGTIFLDEIGDMSLKAQAKLLRVIELREVVRLGSNQPRRVDFRLVTASNKDLETEVERGNLREDLFFRLNAFSIIIPPLRDRVEDIPVLARSFLEQFCKKNRLPVMKIDAKTMAELGQRPWRGNVRELKAVVERSAILSDGGTLELHAFHTSSPAQGLDIDAALRLELNEERVAAWYAHQVYQKLRRYDKTCEALQISFKTLKKRLATYEEVKERLQSLH